MDLLRLGFRSLGLGDAKPSRDNYHLQIEHRKDNAKRDYDDDDDDDDDDDGARERRNGTKTERTRDEYRTINLDEVAWHDASDDCWLVIYDYVYDCTEFLRSHPGGQDVLLEYAGRDATLAFIGTGHSAVARAALERYRIGELPREEMIFRIPDGVKVPGF